MMPRLNVRMNNQNNDINYFIILYFFVPISFGIRN